VTRCNNWPAALALFVEEKRGQPFAWGENDCALFVCDWLTILTGTDPASKLGFRGRYHTALGAVRVMQPHGGVSGIARSWCSAQNWLECRAIAAGRGDVILAIENGRESLGVCLGSRSVFAGAAGAEFRSTSTCVTAWRVS
jgi:hypothetical protein